jgi:hypothetical protein
VLAYANTQFEELQRYGLMPQQPSASAVPAVPEARPSVEQPAAPQTPTAFGLSDDDYVTGKDVKALMKDIADRQVNPAVGGALEMAASANFGLTQQKFAKDFQNYGPEIIARLASVPKNMWTIDNLETVVKLVRSDHIEDIARERATEMASSMEPTIRSTGGGSAASVPIQPEHSLESEKIPTEWKERAARVGLTDRDVREFCAANNMTPEEFYKQFDTPRNAIVTEVSQKRDGRTEASVG